MAYHERPGSSPEPKRVAKGDAEEENAELLPQRLAVRGTLTTNPGPGEVAFWAGVGDRLDNGARTQNGLTEFFPVEYGVTKIWHCVLPVVTKHQPLEIVGQPGRRSQVYARYDMCISSFSGSIADETLRTGMMDCFNRSFSVTMERKPLAISCSSSGLAVLTAAKPNRKSGRIIFYEASPQPRAIESFSVNGSAFSDAGFAGHWSVAQAAKCAFVFNGTKVMVFCLSARVGSFAVDVGTEVKGPVIHAAMCEETNCLFVLHDGGCPRGQRAVSVFHIEVAQFDASRAMALTFDAISVYDVVLSRKINRLLAADLPNARRIFIGGKSRLYVVGDGSEPPVYLGHC